MTGNGLPAPLSKRGQQMLETAEATIEAGLSTFLQVGKALVTIRDGKLYRDTHHSFEDYCRARWNFTSRRANQLMDAAEIGTMVPISNERQARAIAPVADDPAVAREVWDEASADGKPTAAKIAKAVERRQPPANVDPETGEITATSGRDQSDGASPDAAGPGDDQQGHETDAPASAPAASPAPKVPPLDATLGYRATATRFREQVRSSLLTLDPERVTETSDDHEAWRRLSRDAQAWCQALDKALSGPRLKAVQ